MSAPAGLVPDWPVPPQVRAWCSTRAGGVSQGAWASLNLGGHVGDDPAAVAENRRRYAAALDARPVFLDQVHGRGVLPLDRSTPDGAQADGCWTAQPGVACTVMVADCLPVLFAHAGGRAVAAAHAGWRGLLGDGGQGVLEATWSALWPQLAADAAQAAHETLVWLGPCIGPQAFEVGDEVRDAFAAGGADVARRFRPASTGGKWLADLPGLARDRLQALGLTAVWGNDGSTAWCTVADASRFFSHRRDRVSGRLAASVWLA